MRCSLVSTERRAASVGWAVKTGRTSRRGATSRSAAHRSSSPWMWSNRARSRPRPTPLLGPCSPTRWVCSATFARWKKVEKARTRLVVSAMSRPSRRAVSSARALLPASGSRDCLLSVRTRSTSSRSCGPCCRTRVCPSRLPSSLMSERSAASVPDELMRPSAPVAPRTRYDPRPACQSGRYPGGSALFPHQSRMNTGATLSPGRHNHQRSRVYVPCQFQPTNISWRGFCPIYSYR